MATYSSKSYKLRDTKLNVTIQKGKINCIKIKVNAFIINFGGNKAGRNMLERCLSELGVSVSEV